MQLCHVNGALAAIVCVLSPAGQRLLSQPEINPLSRYQIILLGDRGTQV